MPAVCLIVLYISIQLMYYSIQYFHPPTATWRGTGSGSIADPETAKQRMRALAEMCNHSCDFRIEPIPPRGGSVVGG